MADGLRVALAVLAAGLAFAGGARADEGPTAANPISFTFDVGAASDYEYRGISQTENKPEVFGGVDATILGIGYAGVWVSNVDFLNGTRLEYDLYAGVKPLLGPVTIDFGVIRYGYASQPPGPRETYTEWKVAPSMALGPATIGLAYFYSGRFFRADQLAGPRGKAAYYEINGSLPIGKTPYSLSGAIGRQDVVAALDYNTWNIGLGYAVNSHFGFDLRYWDTDRHKFGDIFKSKLVLGVKLTFP